jgi:hypothetical protein
MKIFSSNGCKMGVLLYLAAGPALYGADLQTNQFPAVAAEKIDFDRDIRPIMETSCWRCHGPLKPRSQFRLDNRSSALKGGDDNTNDIVPGDSSQSMLIHYVSRQVPDMEMPPTGKGDPLTPAQISRLSAWIDQGANWSATNQWPQTALMLAPTLRWVEVRGSQPEFRELEGEKAGFSGGAEQFSFSQQSSPDEKTSVTGRVIVPNQDLELKLAVDKTGLGFVHAGFDEWRKYYNDTGGYDPAVTPPAFNLDRNLYVDNGRAWIDFGLALPHRPQIVLGYEYQFANGNQSMLDWGYANGKNIYPATLAVDERTHIVKLDVTHDFDGWHLEDNARGEFFSLHNNGVEPQVFSGATPGQFVNTRDDYHSSQGMNTLTLEKQIRDWWLLSGGFYYSKLEGSDLFNQTITPGPVSSLSSSPITLHRESEIFSVASLFTPLEYLTFSLGSQNEWTREDGFGNSIPDFDLGANTPAGSTSDLFKSSQNADLRFTKIPFTVLFADARLDETTIGRFQQEDPAGPMDTETQVNARNQRYNIQTGFNSSPWRWAALNAQYQRQSSDSDYDYPIDVVNGNSSVSNGYPGFIRSRKIQTGGVDTKLELRPANWLKTTLTYQLTDTDYRSTTDPAYDFGSIQDASPGGPILDGRYRAQTYGFGITLTPVRRLYFSSVFTYSHSRATTADNGDPSIVPYLGNIYTVTTTTTYALNAETRLQTSYIFSTAGYAENNASAGVPTGLNFTRHELTAGLVRTLTKRLSCALRYQFSQYSEPGSNNANNFTAQGVFAMLAYQWP